MGRQGRRHNLKDFTVCSGNWGCKSRNNNIKHKSESDSGIQIEMFNNVSWKANICDIVFCY